MISLNKLFLRGLNFLGFIFSILSFYIFFEGFSAYLEKQGTLVTDELAFKGVLFTLSVSLFFSYCSLLLYMGDNILNIILSIKNKSKINLYSIITTTLSVIVNIMFFVSMEYNFSISNKSGRPICLPLLF